MATRLKDRSDLRFREQNNIPEPVEFDYTETVTPADMDAVNAAMRHRSGLDQEELDKALNGGILISGEAW